MRIFLESGGVIVWMVYMKMLSKINNIICDVFDYLLDSDAFLILAMFAISYIIGFVILGGLQ